MKTWYCCLLLLVCGGILRGQSTPPNIGGTPPPPPNPHQTFDNRSSLDTLKAMQRNAANADGNPRYNSSAQNVRLKVIKRRKDDPDIPAEYEWDTKPQVQNGVSKVVYPYALLTEKTSGKATVRFRINREGRVDLTMVLEATRPEFGAAAQAAVEALVFTPGKKKDGSPAQVLCDAEFDFKPDGKGDVMVTQSEKDLLKSGKNATDLVVPIAELDAAPKPIKRDGPIYPTALVKEGRAGNAEIEFLIDKDGWVALPRVVNATAEAFGYAAVQAVSGWHFAPPTKKGHPIATRARIQIEFAPAVKPAG